MAITTPTAYWKLDEATGSNDTYADAIGTATGTRNGTVASQAGKLGTAAAGFGGSSTQWIQFPKSNTIFQIGDQDWSTSVWVYHSALAATYVIMSMYNPNVTPTADRELEIRWTSGIGYQILMSRDGTDSGGTQTILAIPNTLAANLTTGIWYHLAFGYIASSDTLWGQFNNGTRATATHAGGMFNGNSNFHIGIRRQGNTLASQNPFNGRIDEVGWWKGYSLTTAEVTELYNSGNGKAYPFTAGNVTYNQSIPVSCNKSINITRRVNTARVIQQTPVARKLVSISRHPIVSASTTINRLASIRQSRRATVSNSVNSLRGIFTRKIATVSEAIRVNRFATHSLSAAANVVSGIRRRVSTFGSLEGVSVINNRRGIYASGRVSIENVLGSMKSLSIHALLEGQTLVSIRKSMNLYGLASVGNSITSLVRKVQLIYGAVGIPTVINNTRGIYKRIKIEVNTPIRIVKNATKRILTQIQTDIYSGKVVHVLGHVVAPVMAVITVLRQTQETFRRLVRDAKSILFSGKNSGSIAYGSNNMDVIEVDMKDDKTL